MPACRSRRLLGPVIAWNRNPVYGLAADWLADPRVTVVQKDVVAVIREGRGSFDSIILDVDNGPAALSTGGNERLYDSAGLRHARAALRPGGCLAVWSVAPDPGVPEADGERRVPRGSSAQPVAW